MAEPGHGKYVIADDCGAAGDGAGQGLRPEHAADGTIKWRQPQTAATYAASTEANGVLFTGGTDFTFRSVDLLQRV